MGRKPRRARGRDAQYTYDVLQRIPEDIWRLIFLSLYDQDSDVVHCGPNSISPREENVAMVSGVCRVFREIVCQTTSLYQIITFGGPNPVINSVERFRKSFERSGSRILHVYISTQPTKRLHHLMTMVLPHIQRIRTLKVFAHPNGGRVSRSLYGLDRLSKLDVVRLTSPPLTELTSLELQNVHFDTTAHAVALIDNNSKLEYIRILCEPKQTQLLFEPQTIRFPSLRTACFAFDFMTYLFFKCTVEAPVIEELSIMNSNPNPVEASYRLRLPWLSTVKTVTLLGNFPDTLVANVVYYTPFLSFLDLWKCQAGDDLIGFYLSRDGENSIAPQLELITITEGYCSDDAVIHLLDMRDGSDDGMFAVDVELKDCPNTTARVGRELRSRDRGTWSKGAGLWSGQASIQSQYYYPTLGLFHAD